MLQCSVKGLAPTGLTLVQDSANGRKVNMQKHFWLGFFLGTITLPACFAQGGEHFGDRYWWTKTQFGVARPGFCSDNHPAQTASAPTVQQAVESFFCSQEYMFGLYGPLIALDNVKIEIARGRPFDAAKDQTILKTFWHNPIGMIDQSALVYPLRGSFTLYSCERIIDGNRGKNCDSVEQPNASGACYKELPDARMDTPLRWRCQLKFAVPDNDASDQGAKKWNDQFTHRGVPPPPTK